MIKVVNKKTYKGPGEYIGRPNVLGNPFKIGQDGDRDQVMQKYRRWLWEKIQAGGQAAQELDKLTNIATERDLVLICWCAPAPCHGDIIKKAIEWKQRGENPW